MPRLRDALDKRRAEARTLRLADKVATVARVLGKDKTAEGSPIQKWVFVDEDDTEYFYASTGEATVLDENDHRLFTHDTAFWQEPIRAYRPGPWTARLDTLFMLAVQHYKKETKQAATLINAELRRDFGIKPKTQPRKGYEP